MLNFGCSDAKCQGSEGAVGACVAVATDNGESWKGDAELWPDDVNDSLFRMTVAEQRYAEFFGVGGECGKLLTT